MENINRSKELALKVKENPEKALERLKTVNMKLTMQKETLQKEIDMIKEEAKQKEDKEMLELINRVEENNNPEELEKIKQEIIEQEKKILEEMEQMFQTDSLVIREIFNEYGMQ